MDVKVFQNETQSYSGNKTYHGKQAELNLAWMDNKKCLKRQSYITN